MEEEDSLITPEFFARLLKKNMGSSAYLKQDYPNIELQPEIIAEFKKRFVQETTPQKERAFIIANKAGNVYDLKEAEIMGFHALSFDPMCIDAWRTISETIMRVNDVDATICALRETLNFARLLYTSILKNDPRSCIMSYHIHPYIRILSSIGNIAQYAEHFGLSIYCYEEIIRLDFNDTSFARYKLLLGYIKIMGLAKKYPETKPVRTMKHVKGLLTLKRNDALFCSESAFAVRWVMILLNWIGGEDWKTLAKDEYKKNCNIYKYLAGLQDISHISSSSELKNTCNIAYSAFSEWPDFVTDLAKLVSKKNTQQRSDINISRTIGKEELIKASEEYLDAGRELMAKKDFISAIESLTASKYALVSALSREWYKTELYPIVTNRAASLTQIDMWNLIRIDTRYALAMKPDHINTYIRLPHVAKAFRSVQLIEEFENIAKDVKANPNKTPEEWKELSKKVIGLTSIIALSLSAENLLTEGKKHELIEIGIDDMYTTVNVSPTIQPMLPWLTDDDLEPTVL